MDRLPGKIADMFSSDDPDDPISEAVNNARDGAAKNFDTWISASFGRSARQQISVEALPSIFLRLMLLFSADMVVDIKSLLLCQKISMIFRGLWIFAHICTVESVGISTK